MKTGFRRRSESNVQVYVDIGDPYPGRAEFIEYFDFANPAFQTPAIKTWGGNNYGQLGFGTTANTSTPTPVGALANWRQISAGALHTAAIRYDSTLWIWGNNSFGQVGDSSTTNRSSPVQIGTRTDWQQVSCGYTHTLAITQDGNLWAWGSNIYNQLGQTSATVSSPIQVGSSNAWIQVSSGGYHSLGIQRDYSTWAWGFNGYSQCGTGGAVVLVPTQIVDENANNFYSISLAAGQVQSLAVSITNELYAWGNNTYGQLGTGDNSQRNNPSKIGSLTTWQSVSSHGLSSGGILTDSSLYVWGYNGTYNLGLGDLVNRSSPVKLGSSNWQEISMGLYHSTAIRYDGSLWTWGFNGNGEIGNNTSGLAAGVSTPIQINSLTNWKRVSAGGNTIDVLHPTNGNVNIAPQGYTVSIAVATDF